MALPAKDARDFAVKWMVETTYGDFTLDPPWSHVWKEAIELTGSTYAMKRLGTIAKEALAEGKLYGEFHSVQPDQPGPAYRIFEMPDGTFRAESV